MPAIVVRPRAIEDLVEAWQYIASDSQVSADRFIDAIDQQFGLIARRPKVGRRRPELGKGVRSLAMGRYVSFYVATGTSVEIIRVLHGARDIGAVFKSEDE